MNANTHSEKNKLGNDTVASEHAGCPHPSPEQSRKCWAAWFQAMELSHEMLMMGLRQKIGPEGDLHAAYHAWSEQYQALKWESNSAS